jgi:hypothetical protein
VNKRLVILTASQTDDRRDLGAKLSPDRTHGAIAGTTRASGRSAAEKSTATNPKSKWFKRRVARHFFEPKSALRESI